MINTFKEIFGKTYQFICENENEEALAESIMLYPDSDTTVADVVVAVEAIGDRMVLARNPSIFTRVENGMITQFPACTVFWDTGKYPERLVCQLQLSSPGKIRKLYSRFFSMEYATDAEWFEQVLHELVLIPSVYFLDGLSLIHAAAFAVNDRAVLLAGTGGTGKTSALLSMRQQSGLAFISDDIAVISDKGLVYPNLAWSKVYGYNLSDYITKKELLKGRGIIDKIQFNAKLKKNPKGVRRKMRPDRLFKSAKNKAVPLDRIIYLFRDNGDKPELRMIGVEDAVDMGIHVIKTEYTIFNNFLEWDGYNATALHTAPVLSLQHVMENWREMQIRAFQNVQLQLLHIPASMPHAEYLDYMSRIIR